PGRRFARHPRRSRRARRRRSDLRHHLRGQLQLLPPQGAANAARVLQGRPRRAAARRGLHRRRPRRSRCDARERGLPRPRRFRLSLGAGVLRPAHARDGVPHPFRFPRRILVLAGVQLRVAAVDDARAHRSPARGRVLRRASPVGEDDRRRRRDGRVLRTEAGRELGPVVDVHRGRALMAMAKSSSKTKKSATSKKRSTAKRRPPQAERADRYRLYQSSVQTPSADVAFFDRVFRKLRGRAPRSLREDFCGTGYLSATWAASHRERTALGIDIDPEPLAWGKAHNLTTISPKAAQRVQLVQADVLDGVGDRTEVACAMNFSYGVFKERELLRRYFQVVHDRLEDDGVFFTEIYGGTEAIVELEEERDCEGFTYVWQQERYN